MNQHRFKVDLVDRPFSRHVRFDNKRKPIIDGQEQRKGFPRSRPSFLRRFVALFALLSFASCTTFEASLVMPDGEVLGRVVEKNYIFASRQQTDFVLEYSELDEAKNMLHEITIGRGTAQDGDAQREMIMDFLRVFAQAAAASGGMP